MADKSTIEWTDATWNPTVGCSIVSPGCTHCYAMKVAAGLERRFGSEKYRGLTKSVNGNDVWTGEVRLDEGALLQPLKWKRGRRIFVNSMSDLFHEALRFEDIDKVFAVMALCGRATGSPLVHQFQVLTKRAARMRDYVRDRGDKLLRYGVTGGGPLVEALAWVVATAGYPREDAAARFLPAIDPTEGKWPLPNVWLGVSAERQEEADERIPLLLDTPAAVRFVSAEPLLGPINLHERLGDDWLASGLSGERRGLDWIIVGGESGPKSRPNWVPYVRALVKQCQAVGTARVFVKQLGANVQDRDDAGFEGCSASEWPNIDPANIEENPNGYVDGAQGAPVRIRLKDRKGGDWSEWPEDIRIREFPVTDISVTQSGSASHESKQAVA